MQQTLILLKPDAVSQKVCGKVISRFEDAGLTIRGCKMIQLDSAILKDHYAHIAAKPFYPDVEKFMSSTPVIALILEGDDVIAKIRDMLGVTDAALAAPGTIRADYGTKGGPESKMLNIAHASDSEEAATAEIARFFKPEEIFQY